MEIEEINNRAAPDPVNRIPGNPAGNEGHGVISFGPAFGDASDENHDEDKYNCGNDKQEPAFTGEDSPGGAGVLDKNQIEQAGDDFDWRGNRVFHDHLCNLVNDKNQTRENRTSHYEMSQVFFALYSPVQRLNSGRSPLFSSRRDLHFTQKRA